MERRLLVVAALVFVGASAAGIASLPSDVGGGLRWGSLVLALVLGGPLTLLLNGLEYQATARVLSHRVGIASATRIAVLSSAANLLPIPGAVLVRMQALRTLGSSAGQAVGAATVVGVLWAATAAGMAGGFRLADDAAAAGWLLLGGGLIAAGGSWLLLRRSQPAGAASALLGSIVVLEAGFVLLAALRLFWVIDGLGFEASYGQAVVLSLAGVAASVVGVFPGGLGIREAVAAAIGPLVGLPASVALVAAAVDRVVGLLVLGPAAAVLAARVRPAEGAT